MIEINPQYESIFDVRNIDDECSKIAELMKPVRVNINEALEASLYDRAVTMYLQLLKSMTKHFVEDEHYCYFDDLYSPEYTLQSIFEDFQMHDLGTKATKLLKEGHDEIMQSKCYQEYGYPSYI